MGADAQADARTCSTPIVDWKAQVLHDLHESVPYLYDNTIGDGPYNAWIDPILADEWQMIGWNNVQEMTQLGMPGVFAHGTFDTWSPGYLMFIAATHNGISRLYETFGNGGTPTPRSATLRPDETRAPGTSRIRRCRARTGRCATTTTTSRPACSSRSTTSPTTGKLFLAQLLREEQALDPEGEDRRAGRVRAAGRRSAPGRAGRAAARAAEAGRRDLARDRGRSP